MKRILKTMLLGLVVLAAGLAPLAAQAGEKALCLVCSVKSGEGEPEDVAAWRTHDGVRYGFCAEDCAKEFDADPAAYLPPTFPRPAPEIGLTDLAGKPMTLEALKGKVVLLDFWATWCAPCRKTMPELQRLHDKHAARGFTVVGVAIDEGDARKKVQKFLTGRKIAYPNALDVVKSSTWERYRVKAVPAAFLIDQEGRIVAQWTGAAASATEIEAKLASLLPQAD
jgi:thiol-disulfide isomerase/thioredoxin